LKTNKTNGGVKAPIKLNIMTLEEKIEVLEVCKGNSECIVEDVKMYHLKLLNLDIDDNYKEKLISILEGYETTLKMAMRDVKELKTIYVK